MKVGQVSGVAGVYNKQGVNKVGPTGKVEGKKDVVSISGPGHDFNTVMRALKDVPEVRMDKVEELSQKVESGNYSVDGKEIAEAMAKNIADKLL